MHLIQPLFSSASNEALSPLRLASIKNQTLVTHHTRVQPEDRFTKCPDSHVGYTPVFVRQGWTDEVHAAMNQSFVELAEASALQHRHLWKNLIFQPQFQPLASMAEAHLLPKNILQRIAAQPVQTILRAIHLAIDELWRLPKEEQALFSGVGFSGYTSAIEGTTQNASRKKVNHVPDYLREFPHSSQVLSEPSAQKEHYLGLFLTPQHTLKRAEQPTVYASLNDCYTAITHLLNPLQRSPEAMPTPAQFSNLQLLLHMLQHQLADSLLPLHQTVVYQPKLPLAHPLEGLHFQHEHLPVWKATLAKHPPLRLNRVQPPASFDAWFVQRVHDGYASHQINNQIADLIRTDVKAQFNLPTLPTPEQLEHLIEHDNVALDFTSPVWHERLANLYVAHQIPQKIATAQFELLALLERDYPQALKKLEGGLQKLPQGLPIPTWFMTPLFEEPKATPEELSSARECALNYYRTVLTPLAQKTE
jgi:hypothetical protein